MLYSDRKCKAYIYPPGASLSLDWHEVQRRMHFPDFESDLDSNSIDWLKEQGHYPPPMPKVTALTPDQNSGVILVDEGSLAVPTAVALMLMRFFDIEMAAGLQGLKIDGQNFPVTILKNQLMLGITPTHAPRVQADLVKFKCDGLAIGLLEFRKRVPSPENLAALARDIGIECTALRDEKLISSVGQSSNAICFAIHSIDKASPVVQHFLGAWIYFSFWLSCHDVPVRKATLYADWTNPDPAT